MKNCYIKFLTKGIFGLLLIYGIGVSALMAQHEGLSWFAEGENLRRQARYEPALKAFEKAIEREPSNYKYHYGKAECEYKLKKIDVCKATLSLVIRQNSTFAPGYALLAKIYAEQNDIENAAKLFDIAARYEKESSIRLAYKFYVIDYFIHKKDFDMAFKKVAEAKLISPNDVKLRFKEAYTSNILGKYERSITAMEAISEELIKMPPQDAASFYFEWGYALYQLGQYEKSFSIWEKAQYGSFKAKIEVFTPTYLGRLAIAYEEVYEFDLCDYYIEKVQKIQPNNSLCYFLKGEMERRKADQSKAIEQYIMAARFEQDIQRSVITFKRIAGLELDAQQYVKGIETCEKGLSLSPKDFELNYIKSLCLYKLGNYSAAIDQLKASFQDTPHEVEKAKCMFLIGLAYKNGGDFKQSRAAFSQVKVQPYQTAAIHEIKVFNEEEIQ